MFLSTTPFLTRAIKLYERAGFRRIGERVRHLDVEFVDIKRPRDPAVRSCAALAATS
jgi:ribosomal protein S18 acetylase RimI-like enzyme